MGEGLFGRWWDPKWQPPSEEEFERRLNDIAGARLKRILREMPPLETWDPGWNVQQEAPTLDPLGPCAILLRQDAEREALRWRRVLLRWEAKHR